MRSLIVAALVATTLTTLVTPCAAAEARHLHVAEADTTTSDAGSSTSTTSGTSVTFVSDSSTSAFTTSDTTADTTVPVTYPDLPAADKDLVKAAIAVKLSPDTTAAEFAAKYRSAFGLSPDAYIALITSVTAEQAGALADASTTTAAPTTEATTDASTAASDTTTSAVAASSTGSSADATSSTEASTTDTTEAPELEKRQFAAAAAAQADWSLMGLGAEAAEKADEFVAKSPEDLAKDFGVAEAPKQVSAEVAINAYPGAFQTANAAPAVARGVLPALLMAAALVLGAMQ